MRRFSLLLMTCITWCALANAQTAPPADIGTIKQQLNKLNVLGSVLYIAAHPDDENTRLLAYLAQEKHYRTGYLSLTRGDGGQNLIGNEQGELLGLIRTQELLAARRTDGAEQFFTRANDFGFSKNPEETLTIWDREKILGDVVWVIRKFKPDVMICRFPTTGEGGHGHHTTSAILAQEAFTAAANPKRFPEQLKYVQPWQAKRLLWNTFNFGGNNTTANNQFKIDIGSYNPLLGKGYGEIAAESRSNHRSQGFGTARQRGQALEYFKTILGPAPQTDLMEDIVTSWNRVPGGIAIGEAVKSLTTGFDADQPEKSVPALVKLQGQVSQIKDTYWREQKIAVINNLIAACAGLWFESYVTTSSYAIGEQMQVRSQVISRSGIPVKVTQINSRQLDDRTLPANELQTFESTLPATRITQPYWLEAPHGIGMYTINDDLSIGNPENPNSPAVTFEFMIAGRPVCFERRLMYKYVDPARGELYQPVEIVPSVTLNPENKVYVFNTARPQQLQLRMKSFMANASGKVTMPPVAGWKISPESIDFTGKDKGAEWLETFTVTPTGTASGAAPVKAMVITGGHTYDVGIQRIRYEHIPGITLFPRARVKLVNINLKTAGKKIGYLPGAGDLMPDALRQVGYDVHLLTDEEVMNTDLSVYDAIVTGIRAYNVSDRLPYEQPKLLNYVKNGGNLVVQYNNFAGLKVNPVGPYPFTVVNERVTNENATVTIAAPQSPLLNYPNKITQADFEGWVQERGLYFVSNISPEYQAPLEMNDAGEAPNKGSLIAADYGKGRFVYTSLAFFRQLPAGVPGAYRLFVNLLSKRP